MVDVWWSVWLGECPWRMQVNVYVSSVVVVPSSYTANVYRRKSDFATGKCFTSHHIILNLTPCPAIVPYLNPIYITTAPTNDLQMLITTTYRYAPLYPHQRPLPPDCNAPRGMTATGIALFTFLLLVAIWLLIAVFHDALDTWISTPQGLSNRRSAAEKRDRGEIM